MVKVGDFALELIDADTKEPFKEHVCPSSGKTYVEVEPDGEYFVRITATTNKKVCGELEIDGETLGYQRKMWMRQNGVNTLGIWNRRDGVSTQTSLKFTSKTSNLNTISAVRTPAMWTGSVKAKYYKAIQDGKFVRYDHESKWSGNDLDFDTEVSDQKYRKGVKTKMGIKILDEDKSDRIAGDSYRYKKGQKLQSIKVHYCSTPGLITAGILPKPPMWEHHKKMFPCKRNVLERVPIVTPKKIKCGGSVVDGTTIVQPKEHEFFDLTYVSDSGDDK